MLPKGDRMWILVKTVVHKACESAFLGEIWTALNRQFSVKICVRALLLLWEASCLSSWWTMLTSSTNSLISSSLISWWKTPWVQRLVVYLGFSGVTVWIPRLSVLAKLLPVSQSLSCFQEEPKKVCFTYDLFLNLEGNPPVNHLRCEKLTFNNPTKEFRRKLIRAGGVSASLGS